MVRAVSTMTILAMLHQHLRHEPGCRHMEKGQTSFWEGE